jgi:hypothetical protein
MKDILFNGRMIQAIKAGTKTQTRRLVKITHRTPGLSACLMPPVGLPRPKVAAELSPHRPGDLLLVKEAAWMWCERRPNGKTKTGRDKWTYVPMQVAPIHYAADHPSKPKVSVVSPDTGNAWGWRLKIGRFLPRWACRIVLRVKAVRAELLNTISETDALDEGISTVRSPAWDARHFPTWYQEYSSAIAAGTRPPVGPMPSQSYAALWEEIHGPGSWALNPWVWVLEFKVVKP